MTKAAVVAWFVLIVVLVVGGVVWEIATVTHRETVTGCKVVDKDRTTNSKGVSDARIYTDNCGVFQVKDSWTSGTWSSADRYNKIKVGKTYDFDTQGRRVPFFSQFPNIIQAREVG